VVCATDVEAAVASVELVAAATTAAAAPAAARWRSEGFGAAAGCGGTEDAQLDGGFLAGAFGTGDFLLLIDYDFFEFGLTVVADVFVDGHSNFFEHPTF
jgi:hypothetical protein